MTQVTLGHAGSMPGRSSPSFAQAILEVLSRSRARRQTVRELERLDDRMLADIGLSRAEIGSAAAKATGTPPRGPSLWARTVSGFLAARSRARMIRELNRLPDNILSDIGVPRWQIEDAVDGILAAPARKTAAAEKPHAPASPVHELLRRIETAILPLRRWQMSRVAAGQMARLNRETLSDLGYVKGDVDWVPDAMANRHLSPAANRNLAHAGVA